MARIMIIDDSAEVVDILSTFLHLQGHQIFEGSLKASIYKQLDLVAPDIILLDIILNGHDGRQLCLDIKFTARYKNIPVILMSASAALLKYYKDFKADDFIEKPFDIYGALEKITSFLEPSSF